VMSTWSGLRASLIDAFEKGVPVQVVEFPEDSPDLVMAYNVSAHDVDSNSYKSTSLREMVIVANKWQTKTPGGDWAKVQSQLEAIYGSKKRMFVYRMIVAAQTMTEKVLEALEECAVPNSYIYENIFFVGQGADAQKRLSEESRIKCIEMLHDSSQSGQGMSAKVFVEEYCLPIWHAERWVAQKQREFGKLASLPAFQRVCNFLLSSKAKAAILSCMRQGVRLEGISAEQPGIEQCRLLIEDLQKLKTGNSKVASAVTDAEGQEGGGDGSGEGEQAQAATSGAATSSGDCGVAALGSVDADMDEFDPVKEAATRKTDAALQRFNVYASFDEMLKLLPGVILPSQKVLFFVDAPTSKTKIICELVDQVAALSQAVSSSKVRVLIPVGRRLDIVLAVDNTTKINMPKHESYWIQLTPGDTQSSRRKPESMQYLVPAADAKTMSIPVHISALASRAKRGEGTRLRCMCKECPLRPVEELRQMDSNPDAWADVTAEIDEDLKDCIEQEQVEDKEDPLGETLAEETALVPPGAKRDCVMDVWVFARPREFYKMAFDGVLRTEALTHFVYLTTTAHPAALLAASDINAQCHVLFKKVSKHSQAHGQHLLREAVFQEHYDAEKKSQTHTKRVLSAELSFVKVAAPEEQPIRFEEIAADESVSKWRAGYNLCPSTDMLQVEIPKLLSLELEAHSLGTTRAGTTRRLTTFKCLREEDTMCPIRCLIFSTPSAVSEFLNQGGNAALLDGPVVQIGGVLKNDGEGKATYYVIPVGVGRLLTDYRGNRKHANVILQAHPHVGPNDGFLSLKVRTHNFCGVAANTELYCDFGEYHVPGSSEGFGTPAKKFRGALDAYFEARDTSSGPTRSSTAPRVAAGGSKEGSKEGHETKGHETKGHETKGHETKGHETKAKGPEAKGHEAKGPEASTPAPTSQKSAGNETSLGSGAAAAGGDVIGKPLGLLLKVSDSGEMTLLQPEGSKVNKKVPPKTVLMTFTQGRIDEPSAGAPDAGCFEFVFTKPANQIVFQGAVETLGEVIKSNGIDQLYQHSKFAKGVAPSVFVPKKKFVYLPAADERAETALKVAKASSTCTMLWILQAASGKLKPAGVAIVATKQIVVKATSAFKL